MDVSFVEFSQFYMLGGVHGKTFRASDPNILRMRLVAEEDWLVVRHITPNEGIVEDIIPYHQTVRLRAAVPEAIPVLDPSAHDEAESAPDDVIETPEPEIPEPEPIADGLDESDFEAAGVVDTAPAPRKRGRPKKPS